MPRIMLLSGILALLLTSTSTAGEAQLLDRKAISLNAAKTIAAAAEAEAERNNWNVAIAVVDAAGELILFHKRDGTQYASLDIALNKARTAARFRRPTRALQDGVAGGRTVLLAIEGMLPLEGGVPVMLGDEVIGAVGVSGVTAEQDAQIARAGIAALGL